MKRRRLEREREREQREQEQEMMQREKELDYFREWEKQEDTVGVNTTLRYSREVTVAIKFVFLSKSL